jgi:tRNA G18 (ribose-2'-O)-methylase SpoU
MKNRKLKITEMGRMNVEEFKASEKMPLIVVLDDVRSMYNVGSVFRTADAFRVEAIYLCGITAQPPHPEIHKTALGAEDTVAWRHFDTALDAVQSLKEQGYTVLSIEQCEGSTMLNELGVRSEELGVGYAIILGNEVKGVHQEVVDASDGCIEIPQFGTKHSLNVSTTAGIVIWHFAQRYFFSHQ